MRTIYEQGDYRIVELADEWYSMEDLKGDIYNPLVNSDIPEHQLKAEEREFEQLVYREGVYGYELQVWNQSVDMGWEHVSSCFGFVGQYSPYDALFNHYIVQEFKEEIAEQLLIATMKG